MRAAADMRELVFIVFHSISSDELFMAGLQLLAGLQRRGRGSAGRRVSGKKKKKPHLTVKDEVGLLAYSHGSRDEQIMGRFGHHQRPGVSFITALKGVGQMKGN